MVADSKVGDARRGSSTGGVSAAAAVADAGAHAERPSDRRSDSVVPLVRREIHALDAELPLTNLGTDVGPPDHGARGRPAPARSCSAVFAAVALSLALIGLYGVLSYGIAIRRRELAVRLALGAAERQILGMLVKETSWVVLPALVVGIAAAAARRPIHVGPPLRRPRRST